MGMNEVEQELSRFEAALENFNDLVRNSIQQIEQSHDAVNLMWQDSMRERYDERWQPLYEKLREFDDRVGPEYVEIMLERLNYLRRYLHGD